MSKTLDELFIQFGSDKSSQHHNYSFKYEQLLGHLKEENFKLFEIGWGGYKYKDRGGNSARAWEQYFQKALIISADLYEKDTPKDGRIFFFQGDQTDDIFLSIITDNFDPLVIIDDGSHQCPHVIKTFELLFPKLRRRAYYIIEDCHSSYWNEIAVDGTNFGGGDHPNTTINYFKYLLDRNLNREDSEGRIENRGIPSEKFNIESITFYEKMIVIKKK